MSKITGNIKNWIDEWLEENGLTWKDVEVNTVNYHLKEIFSSKELDEDSVIRKIRITASDNKEYLTSFYNLDAIIAIYVYLKDWILLKQTYDGSESLAAIPRNPNKNIRPISVGGG